MLDLTPRRGYCRTGFQVLLLLTCTLGLYVLYWLIRTRIEANHRLGRQNEPWYFWLLMVVPIAFLYPIFSTYALLEKSVRKRLAHVLIPAPLWLLGLLHLVLQTASRLYDVVALWGYVGFAAIAIMQQYAVETDFSEGSCSRREFAFSWIEWVLVVVGSILTILVLVGVFMPTAQGEALYSLWPNLAALSLIIIAFVVLAQRSKTVLLSESVVESQPPSSN